MNSEPSLVPVDDERPQNVAKTNQKLTGVPTHQWKRTVRTMSAFNPIFSVSGSQEQPNVLSEFMESDVEGSGVAHARKTAGRESCEARVSLLSSRINCAAQPDGVNEWPHFECV